MIHGGSATLVVGRLTARRSIRAAVVWGALFGVLILNEALGYRSNFPTAASRHQFERTIGSNAGLQAVIGPSRRVDTLEGFVAWRVFGLVIIVGAIWGLLTATRCLRGEEDAGRWEVLLAGRTSRRHATVQALAGLGVAWAAMWAVTAALAVVAGSRPAVGFAATSSLFYATAVTASAALFLAIGALTSQLARTRRQANALAAGAFGAAYLVRMVADSGASTAWLRWASPLGWVEESRPLTGSQPLALLPVLLVVLLAGGTAIVLAGRRDVGVGLVGSGGPSRHEARLLGSAGQLVVRLERWVVVAWVVGVGVLALIFGITARAAAGGGVAVEGIERTTGRLGGTAGGAKAWIGYEFLYLGALLAFAGAAQISTIRREESDGRADNLLARPLGRSSWLAGHLVVAAVLVVLAGLAAGVGGWVGIESQGGGVSPGDMVLAGINVALPGLVALGVGTLLFGIVPRIAARILYVLVLWSLLVATIGSSITDNHWLLDTAVLTHLGPVPAADPHWAAIAILLAITATGIAAGLAAFRRRDLASD